MANDNESPSLHQQDAPTVDGPLPSTAATPDATRVFGDYELQEEIARGGMGIVYRARQLSLDRTVALKMILAGQFAGAEQVQRFRREAEAAANLDHPHIVPIYEVGEWGGQHYFAMKLIEGGSLPAQRQDVRVAAGLLATVAQAVHHAHQRGILHRDLKPSNILLDAKGEPHVTDFGLARRVDGEPGAFAPGGGGLTQSGAVVGTPEYMAPEQAQARKDLSTATDVFGLGAILYTLLTGRPPFRGGNMLDTLEQVVHAEPPRPRSLCPEVPRDLEVICLKCLAKEPARRYGSAAELADDLRRWQGGEPIQARAVGRLERSLKWARRRPAAAALAGVSILAGLGFLVLGAALWSNAESRATAVQQLATAEDELEQKRHAAEGLNRDLVELNKQRTEAGRRLALADQARDAARTEERKAREEEGKARKEERKAREEIVTLSEQATQARAQAARAREQEGEARLHAQTSFYVRDLNWADRLYRAGERSDAIRLLDGCAAENRNWEWHYLRGVCERQVQLVQGHSRQVFGLAFSRDGTRLATAGRDATARVWDIRGPKPRAVRIIRHPQSVYAVALPADGSRLVTACLDGSVRVWDVDTGELRRHLPGHRKRIAGLAVSADGKQAVSAGWDGLVKVWDLEKGTEQFVFREHTGPVQAVALSADGQWVASGGEDQVVRIWEAATGKQRASVRHPATVFAVTFCPDGAHVVSASSAMIKIADMMRGKVVLNQRIMKAPDVLVNDAATGKACFRLPVREAAVITGLTYQADGRVLATTGASQPVQLWDALSGREIATLGQGNAVLAMAAFSPDGTLLASTGKAGQWSVLRGWEGGVELWRLDGRHERRRLVGHATTVSAAAFTQDGKGLATAGYDTTVRLWRHDTAELKQTLRGHPGIVLDLAVSPDGKWLASAGFYGEVDMATAKEMKPGEVRVWELATGKEVAKLPAPHRLAVSAAAFSPDGKTLATTGGMTDDGLMLWDVPTWKLREKLTTKVRGQGAKLYFTRPGMRRHRAPGS
jgi:WD40 repeat protein